MNAVTCAIVDIVTALYLDDGRMDIGLGFVYFQFLRWQTDGR